MPTPIPIAQIFKIAAGLAQVGFALWLVIRRPRNLANTAFAIAFGTNGVAYAIFNLALPGQRQAGSFAVQGWGVFNWIAVVAMVPFVVFFLQTFRRRTSTWLIALVTIALPMLAADLVGARAHGIGLLAFGGIAIYPATGFALALFALAFARTPVPDVRTRCALLGGALAINSVGHLGAGVIQPSPNTVVQIGRNVDHPRRLALECAKLDIPGFTSGACGRGLHDCAVCCGYSRACSRRLLPWRAGIRVCRRWTLRDNRIADLRNARARIVFVAGRAYRGGYLTPLFCAAVGFLADSELPSKSNGRPNA